MISENAGFTDFRVRLHLFNCMVNINLTHLQHDSIDDFMECSTPGVFRAGNYCERGGGGCIGQAFEIQHCV